MTNLIIRKSTYDDIDRMLEQDIEKGYSYVCVDGEEIVGTFYYEEGDEPTYREIYEGQWLYTKPYGVVHRIASAKGTKGVGLFCLEWRYKQIGNIRIDTHRDNIPMQRLLTKLGYKTCGIIYVEDGSKRIAYQKIFE